MVEEGDPFMEKDWFQCSCKREMLSFVVPFFL